MGIPQKRYSIVVGKNEREVCLLKGFPCKWGKCTFCDYIEDNGRDGVSMAKLNRQILDQVTGEKGALEVINSGSCFELPDETLEDISGIVREKGIGRLFLESHWMYRRRLDEMRKKMGIPIVFKIGVETFDRDFRERVLNKNADFDGPAEVAGYFDSPCLMVGIQGQTRDMIAYDIDCLKKYFKLGTVNVYNNNTTLRKRDEELVSWFMEEYAWLRQDPSVEVLYEITDFGVG